MVKNKSEYKGIQKKLVAAIAMVLVASIMVVTSSYAWFTLSTAPEVTGINTSVGSNGNLEMALLPADGDLSKIVTGGTGSSNKWPDSNYYWGNLVNLQDESYGMSNIVLAPARLNAEFDDANSVKGTNTYDNVELASAPTEGELYNNETITKVENGTTIGYKITTEYWATEVYKVVTSTGYLQTPIYGSDGRLEKLDSNTVNGIFNADQGAFQGEGNQYGVRAVGTTSQMSPEAYALRQAKTAVMSAIDGAKSSGSNSMGNYAVPMANMIVQHELNADYQYDQDDYDIIDAAITDLQKVVENLEDAMKQAVVAVGLSQGHTFTTDCVTITTTEITVVDPADDTKTITLDWDGATAEETGGNAIPDRTTQKKDLMAAAAVIATMIEDLGESRDALNKITNTAAPAYTDLQAAMSPLVSTTGIKIVNGTDTYTLENTDQATLMKVATALMGGNATIYLIDGIYADIATMVGNYSRSGLSMTIDANDTSYEDTVKLLYPTGIASVTFTMATDVTAPTNGYHLVYVNTWMSSVGLAKESAASKLITDTYGYIVDLAFRTNAADSSLLLQTEEADRVTGTDTNSVTWGGGSYMQFSTDNLDFTVQQIVQLMDYIRVVLVDNTGKIYGVAKLDVTLTDLMDGTNKVEYNETQHYFFRDATAGDFTDYEGKKVAQTLQYGSIQDGVVKAYLYLYDFEIENGVLKVEAKKAGNEIMPLTQNVAQGLSALVYLDGDQVENKDVAINGNSMTGTMNLQFASSAALDPMDYTFATKATLPKPGATWDGNKLTITPPTGDKLPDSGITYEIYTEVDGNEVILAKNIAEGEYTGTLALPAETPEGSYDLYVRAVHAEYNASEGVKFTTITVPAAGG